MTYLNSIHQIIFTAPLQLNCNWDLNDHSLYKKEPIIAAQLFLR